MKRILRLWDCYVQNIRRFTFPKKASFKLLAVLTSMCLYARAQAPALFGPGRASGRWLCLLMTCCAISPTYAQVRPRGLDAYPEWQSQSTTEETATDATITPLQIGDAIPEALWQLPLQVINHPKGKQTITLNDYRGKLIVLDFWNSACVPCIKAFPKLLKLQRQFSGEVQFLLSNRESLHHVKRLIDKDMIPPGLPVPFDQQTLYAYFPYRVVPHYVWISPDGKVLTVTGGDEISPDHIRDALAGKVAFNTKIDIMTGPPYFTRDAIQSNRMVTYTMLYEQNYPGLPSKVTYLDTTDTPAGISVTNYPLADLYQFAALPKLRPHGVTQPRNRTVYECTDTSALSEQYTYERVGARMDREALRTHILDELNAQTGFFGRIEMRERLCYVIQRDANRGTTVSPVIESRPRNLRSLTNLWNAAMGRLKVDAILLDESDYTGPIDASVIRIRDVEELNNALRPYGLRVVQVQRSIPMLVISDNP